MHRAWLDALGAYRNSLTASGASPGTIRLYTYYVTRLAEESRTRSPWRVTSQQLLDVLAVQHWAPETRRSARAAVRSFYRWAASLGHVDVDPAAGLPRVKVPPRVPRPAPDTVVDRARREAPDRVRLMMELAAYAGLRAGEVARVSTDDLVGDALFVLGKGGRLRRVPLVDLLGSQLRLAPEGWVFPNGLGGHLSPGHVSRLVSEALPHGWTAHTLRHRFATRAYAGTRDLLAVQELLGHSSPETTRRYIQLPTDALRAAVEAAA